jgi:transposase
MLPVYYRKLPGNITDTQTIRKLLKDIEFIKCKKVKLVMDRGFFSNKNLNSLLQNHHKFLIAGKRNSKFVSSLIEQVRESIKDFSNYDVEQDIYRVSSMEKWPYEEYDSDGKVIHESDRRIYVHVYYNGQRAEEEKTSFIKSLADCQAAVLEGSCSDAQQQMCDKYFQIRTTPVRGAKLQYNEQAIQDHIKHFGYFALLSNEIKNPSEALYVYRNKDLIEKSFGNLKNRLNMRRPLVSSSENLEGKLFVQFTALMLVSSIHKSMKDEGLYKNYSMQKLLDDLDVIERYDFHGKKAHFSEITGKQKALYECFGVETPGML